MTCIAALEHKGKIWMGADSAGVAGWSLTIRADEKVFVNGPFLMGFTTSFRMGQLLRFNLTAPSQPVEVDDEQYMCTSFVDAVRDCLKTGGWLQTNEGGQEKGGNFLVGYRGHIYELYSDFQVARSVDPIAAVGCGSELALGALHATQGKSPGIRIRTALETAEHFSAGVRGPFSIWSTNE